MLCSFFFRAGESKSCAACCTAFCRPSAAQHAAQQSTAFNECWFQQELLTGHLNHSIDRKRRFINILKKKCGSSSDLSVNYINSKDILQPHVRGTIQNVKDVEQLRSKLRAEDWSTIRLNAINPIMTKWKL